MLNVAGSDVNLQLSMNAKKFHRHLLGSKCMCILAWTENYTMCISAPNTVHQRARIKHESAKVRGLAEHHTSLHKSWNLVSKTAEYCIYCWESKIGVIPRQINRC